MSAIIATARKSALTIAGVLVILAAIVATVVSSETAADAAVPAPSVKVSVDATGTATLLTGGGVAAGVGNVG